MHSVRGASARHSGRPWPRSAAQRRPPGRAGSRSPVRDKEGAEGQGQGCRAAVSEGQDASWRARAAAAAAHCWHAGPPPHPQRSAAHLARPARLRLDERRVLLVVVPRHGGLRGPNRHTRGSEGRSIRRPAQTRMTAAAARSVVGRLNWHPSAASPLSPLPFQPTHLLVILREAVFARVCGRHAPRRVPEALDPVRQLQAVAPRRVVKLAPLPGGESTRGGRGGSEREDVSRRAGAAWSARQLSARAAQRF